jgi:hypothetical protein
MTKTLALSTALAMTVPLLFVEESARAQERSAHDAAGSLETAAPLDRETTATAERQRRPRHSLDISPVSPIMGIYVLQDAYEFWPGNEIMLGTSYMNLPYDCGSTHAVSVFLGYRRFLWRNLHVEYQIWPMYDLFYERQEKRYYESFDLWGEARIGYRIDFDVGKAHLYVNAQWLFGNGLYASNKPRSFHAEVKRMSKVLAIFDFQTPMVFTGVRF